MQHLVIFQSGEGKPGYHQTEGLDDALRFVEHLRNQEQVPDARVYRLNEIPLEVKTYYKVEIAPASGDDAVRAVVDNEFSGGASASEGSGSVLSHGNSTAQDDRPAPEPLSNGGAAPRFGRFNRG